MTKKTTEPGTEKDKGLFVRGRSGRMVALGGNKMPSDQRASIEQIQQVYDEAHQTSLETIRRHREELLKP